MPILQSNFENKLLIKSIHAKFLAQRSTFQLPSMLQQLLFYIYCKKNSHIYCFSIFWRLVNICIIMMRAKTPTQAQVINSKGIFSACFLCSVLSQFMLLYKFEMPNLLIPLPPKCHSIYSSTQLMIFIVCILQKTLARGKETKTSNKPLVLMTQILKISQQFLLFLAFHYSSQYIIL